MEGSIEDIEFLARSTTRVRILEELLREERLTKAELKSRLDASRTTIQRNVAALVDHEWVDGTNRFYEITPSGTLIAENFFDLCQLTDVVSHLGPLLTHVDLEDLDFDLTLLADSEVITAEPSTPREMQRRHVKRTEHTDRARELLLVTSLPSVKAAHDRVLYHDAEMDIIAAPLVAETFRTNPDFTAYIETMLGTDSYDLAIADETPPFYLGILDDTVEIAVGDDIPRAMVETTNPKVRAWAERTFMEWKAEATPFELPE